MSLEARAAQFAPFAALTGYEDSIIETARLTDERIEIDEEVKIILDEKLQIIKDNIVNRPKITFTYFVPDNKKEGGEYVTVTDNVRKVDEYNGNIILTNGKQIPIEQIYNMTGEIIKYEEEK